MRAARLAASNATAAAAPWGRKGPVGVGLSLMRSVILRILVIEHDVHIAARVRAILERRNFGVHVATDADCGLDALLDAGYDAAVIDHALPGRDGFAICRTARDRGIQTPVLILTAGNAVHDRIRGRAAGADDYIAQPIVEEELAARIRALLCRGRLPAHSVIKVGELLIDRGGRSVMHRDKPLALAATEFRILELLALNLNVVLSRDQILETVWGSAYDRRSNIVDVYVGAIRRKLTAVGARERIVAVWGVGYKLAG